MSLLDDASLLVTPNAEKEGKLYSIIPTNGNGDFSVTRATTATRVNAAGLVELVPYNLATYSEQFDNAAWTKNAASVTANSAISPSGVQNADTLTADGTLNFHSIAQSGSAINGVTYTHSIYAKKGTNNFIQLAGTGVIYTGGNVFANFDLNNGVVGSVGAGATATITSVGNGWYRCTMTATATSTTTGSVIFPCLVSSATSPRAEANTLSTSVFLWGAQLVEGTSALDYQMTETRLNIPRLDYSLGSCPNILLEPQRTNLVLRSEEFDNGSWIKSNASVTANATTSPSGLLNGDALIENTATANHEIVQTTSVTTGVSYTFAIYVKANGRDKFKIQLANQFAATALAYYDLVTGLTYSVGAAAAASMTSVGNGWFRCIITSTATSTGTAIHYSTLVSTGTTTTYLGNGTSGVFLWGAQFEAGAYATSYIPTTSASVTRNGDTITRNNVFTNGLVTASGGTWFVDLRNNIQRTRESSSAGVPYLGDSNSAGVGNNFRILGFTASRYLIQKFVAGVATTIYTTTSNTSKIAIKWNGTTADVFENGVKVVTATSFTATALDFLAFRTEQVLFNINSTALFPTPLTDAQCIALTT
jgi:hypothetical protein